MPDDQTIPLDASPGDRIAKAIAHYGEPEVVVRAVALLNGGNEGEEFLLWVGGKHAQGILDGAPALYWPEVWGARTLLFAWADSAADSVIAGLANQAWRVREMCGRVVVARELPAAAQAVPLLTDEVARVRAAGARCLGAIGKPADSELLTSLLKDDDVEVRRAAGNALRQLAARSDAAS